MTSNKEIKRLIKKITISEAEGFSYSIRYAFESLIEKQLSLYISKKFDNISVISNRDIPISGDPRSLAIKKQKRRCMEKLIQLGCVVEFSSGSKKNQFCLPEWLRKHFIDTELRERLVIPQKWGHDKERLKALSSIGGDVIKFVLAKKYLERPKNSPQIQLDNFFKASKLCFNAVFNFGEEEVKEISKDFLKLKKKLDSHTFPENKGKENRRKCLEHLAWFVVELDKLDYFKEVGGLEERKIDDLERILKKSDEFRRIMSVMEEFNFPILILFTKACRVIEGRDEVTLS